MKLKDSFERARACDVHRGDVIDMATEPGCIKPRLVVSVVPFAEVINIHVGKYEFQRYEYNDVVLIIERKAE